MFKLYCIRNNKSNSMYIGMTSSSIERRFYEHTYNAIKLNKKTKFYDAIRKYGIEYFEIILLDEYLDKTTCCNEEAYTISFCRENGINLYNLANGGEGGFVVPENKIEEWKKKLSKARKGKTPALGLKHSDENKKLFSKISNKYWDKNRLYNKENILSFNSFIEANKLTGISKTHYYRLRKQALSNE